ncbi:RagB/SusD family nutrient uptake outer membrane protein [Pedobacter nyackensis]|uniref:Starch-binding associating with outer membrane n=1 Tax=Pedobacter nyackensis TaxID=475255 RepID=A0A1W2EYH8_9SPHI|nr:RagB/SusD family nutrient uptake outer membrane protein [Pedobacter nyackensis]SMD14258.1 Starch-binding associating with outer membrane [Pedobacter nyackensis]
MKYIYSLLFAFALLSISSCKKFLDTTPADFLSPKTYYVNEQQLGMALTGVYDVLGNAYSTLVHYRLGFEGDEGYFARTSPISGPQVYDFTSGHADINSFWSNLYTGIGRANVILANVDNNKEISASVRAQIAGEAKFLRAYYYFLLVQNFGGVPIVLTPLSSVKDTEIARSSVKEVYDQIVKDMIEAEPVVPSIKSLNYGGRVNKSAVRGMLARVYLYMAGFPLKDVSKYAEARDWAKKVIDDTDAGHDLNESYAKVFINYAADAYDIKESIFEVEYWGNRTDAYTETGGIGYVNGPQNSNALTGAGFGGIRATADLYLLYKAGDMRRDWSIANFNYANTGVNGARTMVTAVSRSALYARSVGKYRREFEVVTPKTASATPINCPLLRFSDVLLMYAEAINEISGPTPDAIDAVNRVRSRAWSKGIKAVTITNGGAGYTTAPTVTFSGGGGAAATATISGGKVTALTFPFNPLTSGTQTGIYTSVPIITFSGGGATTNATATATIYTQDDSKLSAQETSSPEDFRQLIYDERSRELAFETLRRADLIRWDIFVSRMQQLGNTAEKDVPGAYYAKGYRNVSEKNKVWPIPLREMTLNKALIQNPKW